MGNSIKTSSDTFFGTEAITMPKADSNAWAKVYYGKHNGKPILWRVLKKNVKGLTAYYDLQVMLLDCDEVFTKRPYTVKGSCYDLFTDYTWYASDLREYLNKTFMHDFTYAEGNLIFQCFTKSSDHPQSGTGPEYEALHYDNIFVLDASDLPAKLSTKYLKKCGNDFVPYWLRSYRKDENTSEGYGTVVTGETRANIGYVSKLSKYGVSPACTLNQAQILFTTRVFRDTYKLTITDSPSYEISLQTGKKVTISGTKVTIPYVVNKSAIEKGYNAVSVLILDKKYINGLNENNAQRLYYKMLKTPDNFSGSGTISFDLNMRNNTNDWGKDYHVYLIAEKCCENNETDYATIPMELTVFDVEGRSYDVSFYSDPKYTPSVYHVLINDVVPEPKEPYKKGYDFTGWYYANGEKFDFNTRINSDLSLYAGWKETPKPVEPEKPPVISYNIWVGKTQVTDENKDYCLGYGRVKFCPQEKAIYFSDASLKEAATINFGASYMLRIGEDVAIKGKVKLSSADAYGGIYVEKGVTLTIEGDVTISAKTVGIFSSFAKEICMKGGNLKITDSTYGILAGGEEPIETVLNFKDGTVEIETQDAGVSTLRNGSINIADKLMITEPRHGNVSSVVINDQDKLAIVGASREAANSILIAEGPDLDAAIPDFVLTDGLEYNNRRFEHIYTAKPIEPTVTVYARRKNPIRLKEGVDYTVSFSNNKNVTTEDSPAVATITYMGNYKGSAKLFFHILPKALGNDEDATPAEGIMLTDIVAVKDGDVSVVMFYNGHRIDESYYTVKRDDKNLCVTIKGKGNFSGSIVGAKMALLSKAEADNTKVKARLAFTYTGEAIELSPDQLSFRDGNDNAISADDCIVTYEDNVNAGLAKAHVIAKPGSGYHGESVIYYDILPDVDTSTVMAYVPVSYNYDPYGVKPVVVVTAMRGKKKTILEEGRDYTVRLDNNWTISGKGVGGVDFFGIFEVSFIGNYEGRENIKGNFTINPATFTSSKISATASDLVYTGAGDYRAVIYALDARKLLAPEDYTVRYFVGDVEITKNLRYTLKGKEAAVSVVLTGRHNYQGSDVRIDNCYFIRKAPTGKFYDLSEAKVVFKATGKAIPAQMYTGSPIKPEVELMFKSKKVNISGSTLGLKEGRDYKVYYFDNVELGTAMVFVKAIGSKACAINSATATFKIVERES